MNEKHRKLLEVKEQQEKQDPTSAASVTFLNVVTEQATKTQFLTVEAVISEPTLSYSYR